MIEINGTTYKLCLLDTNVVSEMLKNPQREFQSFIDMMIPRQYLPCFSLFSILEMRQRPDVFESFLEWFSVFPSLILKTHEQLVQEEIRLYPDPSSLDPILVSPLGVIPRPGMSRRETFEWLLTSPAFAVDGQAWFDGQQDVLDGMLSYVPNFPPKKGRYSDSQIRFFLEVVVLEQIVLRDRSFVQTLLDSGEAVRIEAFPSMKMSIYTVFYKFYMDASRRPSRSDVFDIVTSALFPYVDATITERHQAEVVRKVKARDIFLDKLEVLTLRDLRSSARQYGQTDKARQTPSN